MSQQDENAVIVKNVYKSFRLPHEQHSGIKQLALNVFKKPSKRNRGYETQHVLKDISFEIKKGEFFGIVGRNGSGKSTLLKLLAGIYTADKGAIAVNGSLTPFIELGVGFNPELTGRENVFLNGALLGFSKEEMEKMYDDIVSFAELEKFMDQKLKNYSSGMQVRLAFSIAIRAESDILLIDEVLAVGDADFQQKCYRYFDRLKLEKRTIILVSHDMGAVKQFCDQALLLSNGKVVKIASSSDIAKEYDEVNYQSTRQSDASQIDEGDVTIAVAENGKPTNSVKSGNTLEVTVSWKATDIANVGIIIDKGQEVVFATNSFNAKNIVKSNSVTARIQFAIGDGTYRLRAGLFGRGGKHDTRGIYGNKTITVYGSSLKSDSGHDISGICPLEVSWES